MNIADVTVSILKVPLSESYLAAGSRVSANWHVMARITTADGVRGFGYDVFLEEAMVAPVAEATRELGRLVIGMNVLAVEAAWDRMAQAGRSIGPGGLLHHAIAPLDIAIWDAAGKSLGQPLYRLLGGFRDRLPVYASDGLWFSLTTEALIAAAQKHVATGFRALKVRVGHESHPDRELSRMMRVREAVGPDIVLMAEAAQSWDVGRALATGRLLQEAQIHWLEDPVYHKDLRGLSRIANSLDVPIAAGENLYLLGEFAQFFEANAVGFALIDLGRIGGITPWRRVAALAQAYGLRVCGHVIPEVHVHLLAAIPNGYMVEYSPRSEKILETMPVLEDGSLVASNEPGLGIALNEDTVRRFSV